MSEKGFVYILKDSHFRRGVKIGRAHDVEKRMRPMLTANPWLSVYIKVETSKWKELEKAVHNVIKLVAKTKQVKNSEFYLIEPEKAKKIMLELAPLFDKDDFAIYQDDGSAVNVPRIKKGISAGRHSVKIRPTSGGGEFWAGKTQLAKLIARRGGNEGSFGGILHFFSRKRPCGRISKWRTLLESAGLKFDEQDYVVDWSVAKNPL